MTKDQPTYTASQVCKALGIPHGTLNSWAHAGYFESFDAAETTAGKARDFTFNDAIRLGIIRLLAGIGAPKRGIKGVLGFWQGYHAATDEELTEIRMRVNTSGELFDMTTNVGNRPSPLPSALDLLIHVGQIRNDLSERLVPQNVPQT